MYENNEASRPYVETRLTNTAIVHRERGLVWVTGISWRNGGLQVHNVPVDDRDVEVQTRDSLEAFDLASPRLGYMNDDIDAHYVIRLPLRRDWRQGIRRENLAVLTNGRVNGFPSRSLEPLARQLKGTYPSYKECVSRVEDIFDMSSFSRHFAIDHRGLLHYKGMSKIGEDKGGVPKLSSKYEYLQEALEEEVG